LFDHILNAVVNLKTGATGSNTLIYIDHRKYSDLQVDPKVVDIFVLVISYKSLYAQKKCYFQIPIPKND
jgi:hypothetical protein